MELTRYQKLLLALLAAMLAFFGVLMAIFRTHPKVLFDEGLLKIQEQEGQTVYSGRVHGTPVTITVSYPTNFLSVADFTIGTEIHDVCEVEYPLAPIKTSYGGTVGGIRVTKNGAVVFQGGYDPEGPFDGAVFYDEDGNLDPPLGIRFYSTGGDPWYGYETTAAEAVRFALGAEADAAHGDPDLFTVAVIGTIVTAVEIIFHKQLFRWQHRWARDPEPTEAYLTLERVASAVAVGIIAILYIVSMVKIS